MAAALTAVMHFPKTESAIIVVTNSLSLSDTPDWVSQFLSEIVLDMPENMTTSNGRRGLSRLS